MQPVKVGKSEKLVSPKKIRKMYREAVRESLDDGVAKESRRMLFIRHVIIWVLALNGCAVTVAGIIGLSIIAKRCGL